MKTRQRIAGRPWVAFVDDERSSDGAILVTLLDGLDFVAEPGCGVRGFDTWAEAERETRHGEIVHQQPDGLRARIRAAGPEWALHEGLHPLVAKSRCWSLTYKGRLVAGLGYSILGEPPDWEEIRTQAVIELEARGL